MYLAGYMVAGFIVAGVYATAWLRGRRDLYHRTALVVALSFASLRRRGAQGLAGDWAGRRVAVSQPVKLAAFEGVPKTTTGAPFTIGGFYDAGRDEVRYGIEIPKLLSLLATHDPNGRVDRPRLGAARRPPARERRALRVPDDGRDRHRRSRCSACCSSLTCVCRRRLPRSPWFYRAVIVAGPLAFVALIAGWITTEVGRQPWIVYR